MDRLRTLLPLSLAAAACHGGTPVPSGTPLDPAPLSVPVALDEGWELATVFRGDARINGVACGELDPDAPGDEIVAVDRRGVVRMFRRAGEGFEPLDLGPGVPRNPGELVQVICADLLPSVPGDEVVAVGMLDGGEDDGGPGLVRVLARLPGGWSEARLETPALVHAVTAGDLAPDRPGQEVVVAGYFGAARLLGASVTAAGLALEDLSRPHDLEHQGNAKGACLTDGGFVLACDDGGLLEFVREEGGEIALSTRRDLGATLARIAPFPGDGVVVCDNSGQFRLIERGASGRLDGATTALERADNRLRGAVVADLLPDSVGVEAATAGYDGVVRVVRLDRVGLTFLQDPSRADQLAWLTSKVRVARDSAKLHHLTTGELDGLGLCLVSCGYSGCVLAIHRAGSVSGSVSGAASGAASDAGDRGGRRP
ncbi:MAG: hypothetical protein PVJ89_11175 [Planctomycetota bacterium]|jgi:hypothetical protein